MKVSILMCSIFFLSFTGLFAQEIPSEYDSPEKRAQIMTDEMTIGLPLHNEQVPKIKLLNLKYAKIIQTEIIDTDLSLWSSFFKMKEINSTKEKELLPLFSKSQKENYEKMKKETRAKLWQQFF